MPNRKPNDQMGFVERLLIEQHERDKAQRELVADSPSSDTLADNEQVGDSDR